jgi:hypothetical protein
MDKPLIFGFKLQNNLEKFFKSIGLFIVNGGGKITHLLQISNKTLN